MKPRSTPAALFGLLMFAAGCTALPIAKLERQAKPNLPLSPESRVFARGNRIWPALEPGSGWSGGNTTAGCVGCR